MKRAILLLAVLAVLLGGVAVLANKLRVDYAEQQRRHEQQIAQEQLELESLCAEMFPRSPANRLRCIDKEF